MDNDPDRDEHREEQNVDLIVTSALRIDALERQVVMLGAALDRVQAFLSDSRLNADVEKAMIEAAARVRENQQSDQED